jgi:hypothetical protein
MKRFIALVGSAAALSLAALPGTAAATQGLTGAANMVNTNALPGMLNAMSINNANGVQGMFCAVDVTNGLTTTPVNPGTCPEG